MSFLATFLSTTAEHSGETPGFTEIIFHELLIHNPEDASLLYVNKHVFIIFVAAILMMAIFIPLGLYYKKNRLKAPSKFASFFEVIINFIRDDVVESNLGKQIGTKYLPYFLTTFFFILFLNLLGLIPYSATPTSKLAVTMTLSMFTFFIMNLAGLFKKGPIKFITSFVPQGVPLAIAPIMWVIEVISVFSRTLALMIRLFANMTGGHMVLIVLLYLGVFYYNQHIVGLGGKVGITIASIMISIAIMALEVFVCLVQAYIFTLLTAVFIAMATEDH